MAAAAQVAKEAADGERHHELFFRHVQRTGREHKRRERHGGRKDRRERDGEDGVVLHPASHAFEDALRNVLFEECDAAGVRDFVG